MSKKGNCPVCGKEVLISDMRDVRNNTPIYCSRVCASNKKYVGQRYAGSGKTNRPTLEEILKRKAI